MEINYSELIKKKPQFFFNESASLPLITDCDKMMEFEERTKYNLKAKNKPEGWGQTGVVFTSPYYLVLRDVVMFPSGKIGGYMRFINVGELNDKMGVGVLARHKDGRFLLLHHFRHATRQWHLEIPRGFGEVGVDDVVQARTEFKEETGADLDTIRDLGIVHPNNGIEREAVHLFCGEILGKVNIPEEDAGINGFLWVNLYELEDLIAKDIITDAFTIAAYTKAKLNKYI